MPAITGAISIGGQDVADACTLVAVGDNLIECAMNAMRLPRGRLQGERGRTVGQLRLPPSVARRFDGAMQPA